MRLSPAYADSFDILVSRLTQTKIPGLDGIRAVAISLVVLYHLHFALFRRWEESLGRTGVTLFFVLSGFLITWLLIRENDRIGDISLKKFYARRFLRIFPGFYGFWIMYVGLALLSHKHVSWGNCIAAVFYVNNYYWPLFGGREGGMLLTWSLSVEEQFYLVWPWLFKRFRFNLNSVSIVLAILCGVVLLHRMLLMHVWHVHPRYLYSAFDSRMDSLATGCLLAIAVHTGRARRVVCWLCAHWMLPCLTMGLFALSMSMPSLLPNFHYWNVEGFTVESLLSSALIAQMIVLGDHAAWQWINWRSVRFLGTISYSLYLYNAIGPDAVNSSLFGHTILRAPLGLLAGLTLATASHYLVEKPFLQLKSNYTAKPRRRAPASEPMVVLTALEAPALQEVS